MLTNILGTMDFIDDAKGVEGAGLVRRGAAFPLAPGYDSNGPQTGGAGA
ncbi:hypothetical protein [Streptomyces sp. NPDC050287]